jgi:hypothetical protein
MANKNISNRGEQPMKLAEALLVRADMKKKLGSIRERLAFNARTQEGEKPHEAPGELLQEATAILKAHEQLVIRIDQANGRLQLADGRTLMEALCERESLTTEHLLVAVLLDRVKQETDRYSSSEIRWKPTFCVKEYQKRLEELTGRLREINTRIQEANWQAEL